MSAEKYQIPDIDFYQKEMVKPMAEKLFFQDMINFDSIVDIGCADGILLQELSKSKPQLLGFGFDANPEMVKDANTNFAKVDGLKVFQKKEALLNAIADLKIGVVNLSSVLHEIYNGEEDDVIDVLNLIKQINAEHIVIRDMYCGIENKLIDQDIEEPWANFYKAIYQTCEKNEYLYNKLSSYLFHRGAINSRYKLLDFALKYRYDVNWEHEVEEDYLAVKWDEIFTLFKVLGYEISYKRKYSPTFIRQTLAKDFGLDETIVPNTHLQMIWKRS